MEIEVAHQLTFRSGDHPGGPDLIITQALHKQMAFSGWSQERKAERCISEGWMNNNIQIMRCLWGPHGEDLQQPLGAESSPSQQLSGKQKDKDLNPTITRKWLLSTKGPWAPDENCGFGLMDSDLQKLGDNKFVLLETTKGVVIRFTAIEN